MVHRKKFLMPQHYYYFVASLPLLNFPGNSPYSAEEFFARSRELLTVQDAAVIGWILAGFPVDERPRVDSSLLKQWFSFEETFRNEQVFVRAQRLGKSPQQYMRGERRYDATLTDALQQAAKQSDPLNVERALDKIRWEQIDALLAGHYFDFDTIVAYALKLKILLRYQEIESPKGRAVFEEFKTTLPEMITESLYK